MFQWGNFLSSLWFYREVTHPQCLKLSLLKICLLKNHWFTDDTNKCPSFQSDLFLIQQTVFSKWRKAGTHLKNLWGERHLSHWCRLCCCRRGNNRDWISSGFYIFALPGTSWNDWKSPFLPNAAGRSKLLGWYLFCLKIMTVDEADDGSVKQLRANVDWHSISLSIRSPLHSILALHKAFVSSLKPCTIELRRERWGRDVLTNRNEALY